LANISKISRISIREEFPDEAQNFTPWLKENLNYIGEKLHLSFTDEVEIEVPVGRYSCDVMAHTTDGQRVVIENQFGNADHDHLGKILTYAAGLEADILIWIAEDFLPEHISALNWLNSITSEETPSFFAIKIGLIKIEDSKPALEVNTIVYPDQWARQVKTSRLSRERSEKSKKYNEFWQHFVTYFDKVKNGFKNKSPSYDNYVDIPSGISKFNFTFLFTKGKFPAIQLWLGHDTKEKNEENFEKLKSHQAELESVFPNLEWYNNPENKSKIILIKRDKEYDFSDINREEVMEWLSKTMQKFEKSFYPLLQNL